MGMTSRCTWKKGQAHAADRRTPTEQLPVVSPNGVTVADRGSDTWTTVEGSGPEGSR